MRLNCLLLALVFSVTMALADSGNRTGTNSAPELLIPIGPRDIAMGGSTVALTSGPEALFWNPAGIASINHGVTFFASHMSYLADIGVECASVAVDFPEFGVLALQLKALSIGQIPLTTVYTPDGSGQTFTPQFFTLGFTYGRQLTDRVRVGATVTLISERMAEVSASGYAFDMGVIYNNLASIQGLSFGIAVKNIGPQIAFDGPGLNINASSTDLTRPSYYYRIEAASFELPSTVEMGVGYRYSLTDEHSLVASTAFQNNNFADDAYRIGFEYGFRDLLFLRGGYDYAPSTLTERESIFGATFGVGVHAFVGNLEITVDYAYRSAKYFDANQAFAVKIGL